MRSIQKTDKPAALQKTLDKWPLLTGMPVEDGRIVPFNVDIIQDHAHVEGACQEGVSSVEG